MIVYIHSYIHYIHCLEKASPSSYRLFRVISPNKKILIGESYSFGPCKNIARSFLFLYKYYIIIKMKDDLEQIEEETKRKAKEREKKVNFFLTSSDKIRQKVQHSSLSWLLTASACPQQSKGALAKHRKGPIILSKKI